MGVDIQQSNTNPGGNMEGKEVRFGVANSALWATATTAASNGSVNEMHDSNMPLGGMIPLWLLHLGEIIYGGVGSDILKCCLCRCGSLCSRVDGWTHARISR